METPIEYQTEKKAIYRINPEIYPLDVVQAAAYIMMDKAFILLDGDPKKEIITHIEAKEGRTAKEAIQEFNEELLNYSVYKTQNENNKELREAIMKRVLLANEVIKAVGEVPVQPKIKDPEGILKSWEEKQDDTKTQ